MEFKDFYKKSFLFLLVVSALLVISSNGIYAEEYSDPDFELKYGVLPDSSFYFLERFFDNFRGPETLAERKFSEFVMMMERRNERAAEKALNQYERATNRLQTRAEKNEDVAERIATKISIHLSVLAEVYERVPEQAKPAIERAMENSVRGRERALEALEEQDPERGERVREETLRRVMEFTPDEAQEGLQRAFEAGGNRAREEFQETIQERIRERIASGDVQILDVEVDYENGILSYSGVVQKPTPCHVLEIEETILTNPTRIRVDISIEETDEICIQVITPEEISGSLEISEEPSSFTIYVDGVLSYTTSSVKKPEFAGNNWMGN